MFIKRSFQKELMDDSSLNDNGLYRAYNELHIINKLLGGNAVTKKGINCLRSNSKNTLKILDVGAGASDILYDIKKNNDYINIFSVDLNKHACQYQKRIRGNNKTICADAIKLPIKSNTFDLVHSSLFFHHFRENEIIILLRNFISVAKTGIIINDLRRNIFAYLGIRMITFIFSKSEFVRNDGPLSVKRAFTKKELKEILTNAGFSNYLIRRKWAFRFLIIIASGKND
jgi:ubiquinone/menaquinone biosynthesis C-methylase UbiE